MQIFQLLPSHSSNAWEFGCAILDRNHFQSEPSFGTVVFALQNSTNSVRIHLVLRCLPTIPARAVRSRLIQAACVLGLAMVGENGLLHLRCKLFSLAIVNSPTGTGRALTHPESSLMGSFIACASPCSVRERQFRYLDGGMSEQHLGLFQLPTSFCTPSLLWLCCLFRDWCCLPSRTAPRIR